MSSVPDDEPIRHSRTPSPISNLSSSAPPPGHPAHPSLHRAYTVPGPPTSARGAFSYSYSPQRRHPPTSDPGYAYESSAVSLRQGSSGTSLPLPGHSSYSAGDQPTTLGVPRETPSEAAAQWTGLYIAGLARDNELNLERSGLGRYLEETIGRFDDSYNFFTGQIEKPWPETPTHSLEEIVESVRLRASPMFGWNSASEGAWVTFVQSVLMTVHNVVEEESENGIQRRLNIYQLQNQHAINEAVLHRLAIPTVPLLVPDLTIGYTPARVAQESGQPFALARIETEQLTERLILSPDNIHISAILPILTAEVKKRDGDKSKGRRQIFAFMLVVLKARIHALGSSSDIPIVYGIIARGDKWEYYGMAAVQSPGEMLRYVTHRFHSLDLGSHEDSRKAIHLVYRIHKKGIESWKDSGDKIMEANNRVYGSTLITSSSNPASGIPPAPPPTRSPRFQPPADQSSNPIGQTSFSTAMALRYKRPRYQLTQQQEQGLWFTWRIRKWAAQVLPWPECELEMGIALDNSDKGYGFETDGTWFFNDNLFPTAMPQTYHNTMVYAGH